MQISNRAALVVAVVAGFLTAYAVSQENFVLVWVCFSPLFVVLNNQTGKLAFLSGVLFGAAISLAGFFWMIPGAERFTGSSIFYGVVVFIISSCFFCVFFGLIALAFSKLQITGTKRRPIFLNALLATCIFCIAEALLMYVSSGFPWFDFHSGYALCTNLYAIQPASYFGVYILTFVVILVNGLVAGVIIQKRWLWLLFPAGIIAVYLFAGYLILQNFDKNLKPGKAVNIAILSENIPPEVKWNDNNGNLLAGRLLDMNRTAITLKPDIALWSESALPWTYKKNDDLVDSIIKITKPANITHILGINTEAGNGNMVYNSAYCLLPDGTVAGRYDKQVLLALIEKPLGGAIIPFMSSNGFTAKAGQYNIPLNTPYGKIGIIICNESAVPSTAYLAARAGAEFICNLSNDGWFNNTYIVGLHFYNARLRAVETRKDVAANSNNGYSGLVNASGRIIMQERSDAPLVRLVTVYPNHYNSLYVDYPYLFVYLCVVMLVILLVIKFSPAKLVKGS
jgi:apolipoprotein N-acyltransferase